MTIEQLDVSAILDDEEMLTEGHKINIADKQQQKLIIIFFPHTALKEGNNMCVSATRL